LCALSWVCREVILGAWVIWLLDWHLQSSPKRFGISLRSLSVHHSACLALKHATSDQWCDFVLTSANHFCISECVAFGKLSALMLSVSKYEKIVWPGLSGGASGMWRRIHFLTKSNVSWMSLGKSRLTWLIVENGL